MNGAFMLVCFFVNVSLSAEKNVFAALYKNEFLSYWKDLASLFN